MNGDINMVNIELLHYELEQAGLPVSSVNSDERIDYSRELTAGEQTTADAVIAAHDPDGLLPQEEDEITAREAKQSFRNMPGWATMTPQEADQYIDDNVNDLASAKVVLRKMAKMLMCLRDVTIRRVD